MSSWCQFHCDAHCIHRWGSSDDLWSYNLYILCMKEMALTISEDKPVYSPDLAVWLFHLSQTKNSLESCFESFEDIQRNVMTILKDFRKLYPAVFQGMAEMECIHDGRWSLFVKG
jgi:hypothetical protein